MTDSFSKLAESQLNFTSAKRMIEKTYAQKPEFSLAEIMDIVMHKMNHYHKKANKNIRIHFFINK